MAYDSCAAVNIIHYLGLLTDLSAGQAVHAAAGGLQRGAAGEGDRAVRRQVQVRHPRHRLVQPVTQDLLQKIFGERQKIFVRPGPCLYTQHTGRLYPD